jgi:hypothetical protein
VEPGKVVLGTQFTGGTFTSLLCSHVSLVRGLRVLMMRTSLPTAWAGGTRPRAELPKEPLLLDGMVRIREGQRERIVEVGRGLGEADAVLPEVGGGLPRIPLVHRFSLAVASRRALESRRSSGRGGAPDGFHRRSRTTPAERSSA